MPYVRLEEELPPISRGYTDIEIIRRALYAATAASDSLEKEIGEAHLALDRVRSLRDRHARLQKAAQHFMRYAQRYPEDITGALSTEAER